MKTITINVPNDLQKVVDQKVLEGGYTDSSAYIVECLHQAIRNDQAEEALEAAWEGQLDQRVDEIKRGTAGLLPADQIYSAVDKILKFQAHAAA